MKALLVIISMLLIHPFVKAGERPDAILGVWQNGTGKGQIQIFKHDGKYYGKIIWMKQPNGKDGRPRIDVKNSNKDLRTKPLLGKIMLRDFEYDHNDQEWQNGKVYNPEDGKEYSCYMRMKDNNTLSVRGYLGFSWIGKTDTWQRVK
ncbi:MAG: hypothetical protein JWQ96_1226 [Segetibacter sp.]|nr:hypothetical protein [Segetibacter sp.]